MTTEEGNAVRRMVRAFVWLGVLGFGAGSVAIEFLSLRGAFGVAILAYTIPGLILSVKFGEWDKP